jgi:hypothetical protein
MNRIGTRDHQKIFISSNHLLRVIFFFFHLSLFTLSSNGQSAVLTYAHRVIDTLTSPRLNGRGYVDSADRKAALFIRGQMMDESLQSIGGNYFQTFSFDANTFPDDMKITLDRKVLVAGKDFIVDAGSHSCSGTFRSIIVHNVKGDTSLAYVRQSVQDLLKENHADKYIFIQRDEFTKEQYALWKAAVIQTNAFSSEGIVEFTNEKLTWDASQEQLPYCYLQVKGQMPAKKKPVIELDIDAQLKKNYQSQNVIGMVKGTSIPDSFLVFTAHYDHLGQMGDANYFPGANDNASGVSMLLNLAHHFSENPLKYSVAFIAFSGEELGLVGSSHFVNHPLIPLAGIRFLINLDIVGTGDEGIKVVNATEFPVPFNRLVKLNEEHAYLKQVSPRGKAANSDHYPFYEKGVPCFFIYTMGGISAYHDVYDRAETLPLTDYEDLYRLIVDFAKSF